MLGLQCCLILTFFSTFSQAFPAPKGDPIPAIEGLVSRILGESYVTKFQYEVIQDASGSDVFEIDSDGQKGTPVLRGNNGVSLASALNFYLKYDCNCSVSWGRAGTGDQLRLPEPLPLPASKLRTVSPVKYRYYQNVCTVSYSMVWWDFARWQREIDWMAMNGLNLILSFTGQEYVWQKFYTSLGLTDVEIKDYFSGSAFLAWQRMGNMKRWGGPLDDGWIDLQAELQKNITASIRQFGMTNVLPGFAGHVPAGIKRVYPNANLTKTADWGNFNSTYSGDYLLEPTDPLFTQLGTKYYQVLIGEFGTDHVFNADTYNEMNPSSADLTFLADTNSAIYKAMAGADKDAVFLMQGWLFHSGFWTNERIKAFLSGVPNDKMIILDLNSEVSPIWSSTESYFGKPFVWCLLHNFGGTRGIYGNLTTIATGPLLALHASGSTMVGTGMTPEAIEHNPVVYDLMGEMSWRQEPVNVPSWLQGYARRRYGSQSSLAQQSWQELREAAYIYHFSGLIKSIVDRGPDFSMGSDLRFNATMIAKAWQGLLLGALTKQINETVGPFRYDLVDIGRQVLCNLFVDLYTMFSLSYMKYEEHKINSSNEMQAIVHAMSDLILDADKLLASDTNFLLGHWIADARNSAPKSSPANVTNNLEFNARNQITMWGPHQNIEDYASKEWAGQVKDYYGSRWSLFTSKVYGAVVSGEAFDKQAYENDRFALEAKWSYTIKSYPTEPEGDSIAVADAIYSKYYPPYSHYYNITLDRDISGNNVFGGTNGPWTRDLSQLVFLCNTNPTCVGFNSNGLLKNSTSDMQSAPGVALFLKKN